MLLLFSSYLNFFSQFRSDFNYGERTHIHTHSNYLPLAQVNLNKFSHSVLLCVYMYKWYVGLFLFCFCCRQHRVDNQSNVQFSLIGARRTFLSCGYGWLIQISITERCIFWLEMFKGVIVCVWPSLRIIIKCLLWKLKWIHMGVVGSHLVIH